MDTRSHTVIDSQTRPAPRPGRVNLVGLSRQEMADALLATGLVTEKQARMRASQIWHWVYHYGVTDFAGMTNMAKGLRAQLPEHFTLDRPEVVEAQVSQDGTRKWLLRYGPGVEAETVFIPDVGKAGALCVSSQVGCTLNCTFCHTGTQRLVRNLTAGEIVGQVMLARDALGEWPSRGAGPEKVGAGFSSGAATPKYPEDRRLSNIVFMGMGEPLYNLDHVATAMDIIADHEGIGISRRRVTVSTSGVVPKIAELGERTGAMLAISLHAPDDELRNQLVPLNKKYPITELMDACRAYPGLSNAKRITFEYVMLKGVNDSDAHAKALIQLLKGVPAKINLIPFNPWPGTDYECSDWATIEHFGTLLNKAGYASPIRTPRGRDILAACGQLKSESEKQWAAKSRLGPAT